MKRKDFLKTTCALGVCSCATFGFLSGSAFGKSEHIPLEENEKFLNFTKRRFSKLMEILNSYVNEDEKKKILESLGRECSKENKDFYSRFANSPDLYFEEVKKNWVEDVIFDKNKNVIRVIGKKTDNCYCPLVDKAITPKEFCNCSVGWAKQLYETVFGKAVNITIEESILMSGNRCSHKITFD
jgi:hypothetical protein